MADKIGVLGENSGTTIGTHTAYTVPANKGSKVKLFFRLTAGASSTFDIIVNGVTVATQAAMTSGHFKFSTATADAIGPAAAAAAPTGATAADTVAPSGATFMLSAGDLVQYTIGTAALLAMSFQVIGVEVDV